MVWISCDWEWKVKREVESYRQRIMMRISVVVVVLEKEEKESNNKGEGEEKPDPIWKPPSSRAPKIGSPSSHLSPIHQSIQNRRQPNSINSNSTVDSNSNSNLNLTALSIAKKHAIARLHSLWIHLLPQWIRDKNYEWCHQMKPTHRGWNLSLPTC